jgi:hypothetical protein
MPYSPQAKPNLINQSRAKKLVFRDVNLRIPAIGIGTFDWGESYLYTNTFPADGLTPLPDYTGLCHQNPFEQCYDFDDIMCILPSDISPKHHPWVFFMIFFHSLIQVL